MTDTKHFKAAEFACPCCGLNLTPQVFVETLERIRSKLGKAITITSGTRCATHNKQAKGKSNSAHLRGVAVDILCPKAQSGYRYKLISLAISEGINRIGIGDNFIHLDIDTTLPQYQMWGY